jgi:cell division protein FtsL
VQYESRRLFAEIDKTNSEARRLSAENERLQVEKRAQATPARVERLAKEQLKMRSSTPAITFYVSYVESGSQVADMSPARPNPVSAGLVQ